MEFIKTANGRVNNTPKHAFYINAEKNEIKWSKDYKSINYENIKYQFSIPKLNRFYDEDIIIKFDESGLSFKQKKTVNLVPFIAQKFPDTNNFAIEELVDMEELFKIVPLKPRVFVTPSKETIAKAQMGLQKYRESKVENK